VTSASFSPDGTRLASGSLDGAVKLWDVNAKGEQEGPEAAKSSVWAVTFSPDGKTMFVGTHNGGKLVPTPAAKLLPPPPPPPPPPSPPPPPPAPAPAPVAATVQKATALVPTEFKSMAGATAAIAADGTLTVTGNLAKDTYTIKAVVPAGVEAKSIKLETLPDPSLPSQGPGRAGNGNFVVSTVAVLFGAPGSNETPTKAKFSGAKADYEQSNYGVAGAIDDKPETGWAISGGTGKEHVATFDIGPETKIPAGAPLAITIDQQYADGTHTLGKFRISVVQDVPPAAATAPAAAKPEADKKPDAEKKPVEKKPEDKKPEDKKPEADKK
jgi:hypothetical protein